MCSLTGGFLTQRLCNGSFLAFAFRKAFHGLIHALERKGGRSRKSAGPPRVAVTAILDGGGRQDVLRE
jgi:hypothetical protein